MKLIEFNSKSILYRRINGVYWIALKSICEALNLEYTRQFKNAKSHAIFGPALANQPMQVPGDQIRQMICLPEELIYGWLFSINSESDELIFYQKECNHVLYRHFHGVITHRAELYSELSKEKSKISALELELRQEGVFQEWEASKMRAARLWKNIKTTTEDEQELFQDTDFN